MWMDNLVPLSTTSNLQNLHCMRLHFPLREITLINSFLIAEGFRPGMSDVLNLQYRCYPKSNIHILKYNYIYLDNTIIV